MLGAVLVTTLLVPAADVPATAAILMPLQPTALTLTPIERCTIEEALIAAIHKAGRTDVVAARHLVESVRAGSMTREEAGKRMRAPRMITVHLGAVAKQSGAAWTVGLTEMSIRDAKTTARVYAVVRPRLAELVHQAPRLGAALAAGGKGGALDLKSEAAAPAGVSATFEARCKGTTEASFVMPK